MSAHKISLALAFLKEHPDAAANILEQHEAKVVANFIADVPHTYAAPVLQRMLPQQSARLCQSMSIEKLAGILRHLPATQIVAILRQINKERRTAIMQALPTKVQINCKLLLNYSTEMVGAWMTPHALSIPCDISQSEAISYIKTANDIAYTDYVFVVERDRKLKGRIPMAKLISTASNVSINAQVEENVYTITARSLIYRKIKDPQWNVEEAIPVLNKDALFVGVLRHIDLRRYLDKPVDKTNMQSADDEPMTGLIQIYGHSLKSLMYSMKDCIKTDIRS